MVTSVDFVTFFFFNFTGNLISRISFFKGRRSFSIYFSWTYFWVSIKLRFPYTTRFSSSTPWSDVKVIETSGFPCFQFCVPDGLVFVTLWKRKIPILFSWSEGSNPTLFFGRECDLTSGQNVVDPTSPFKLELIKTLVNSFFTLLFFFSQVDFGSFSLFLLCLQFIFRVLFYLNWVYIVIIISYVYFLDEVNFLS